MNRDLWRNYLQNCWFNSSDAPIIVQLFKLQIYLYILLDQIHRLIHQTTCMLENVHVQC